MAKKIELPNGSFEGGHYSGETGNVPDGWVIDFGEGYVLPGGDHEVVMPETQVPPRSDIPPYEHSNYFRDSGDKCLKVFKGNGAIDVTLISSPLDLDKGDRCKFEIPWYNDTYAYNGEKKAPQDPKWNTRIRVGLDEVWSSWVDDEGMSAEEKERFYLSPITLVQEMKVPHDNPRLRIQFQSKWAMNNSGFFMDALSATKLGEQESVPWHYHVVESGSKVSIHGIWPNSISGFVRDARDRGVRFPVVKAVDDMGWIGRVKDIDPSVITIGRVTSALEGCEGIENADREKIKLMAGELVEVIRSRAPLDAVDYWEICNEPDPPGSEGYRKLAHLMIECMEYAEELGIQLALFGLNAGTPEWDEMQAMAETGVFERAREGGHILALHEGTFTSHDPKQYWGDKIPGSPEVDGAGPLNFRYRYLYHLLKERDAMVPLVISEWYCGDEKSASAQELASALEWFDSEASKDYWVWGVCPFTLGPTSQWKHTDWERVYPLLVDYMVDVKGRLNAVPDSHEEDDDEMKYESTTVLIPRKYGVRWGMSAALGGYNRGYTIAQSAQDVAELAKSENVTKSTLIVVNSEDIGTGLTPEWYDEHYPGIEIEYRDLKAETPYELAVKLLPDFSGDVALSQTDYPGYGLGEEPGGPDIKEAGCFVTSFAMMLREAYGKNVEPPWLNELLVFADVEVNTFTSRNLLVWDSAVGLFPAFDGSMKVNKQYSSGELKQLLSDGWLITLARSDYKHFVYLEGVDGTTLKIIDPWGGVRKSWSTSQAGGIRAARLSKYNVDALEIGLHDESGAEEMMGW